jgi:DNA-binding FadR family transcriptional regulator
MSTDVEGEVWMSSQDPGRQPTYRRIAAELRAAVEAGRYGPGDRLPGENDLMAEHGVARMTARQALGVLQAEGIAEARKGAGAGWRGESDRPQIGRTHPAHALRSGSGGTRGQTSPR